MKRATALITALSLLCLVLLLSSDAQPQAVPARSVGQGKAGASGWLFKWTDGTNTAIVNSCIGNTKSYFGINQTAGAQLITGVSAKRIYICSFNLVTATAQNIAVVAGTGTVCATTTVGVPGLTGGATAATGWNLAANGGLTFGNGGHVLAQTTVNADNLCLLQSGAGQVSGGGSYVTQ